MDLIYLRHAEARKNKTGIHGGTGTELSERGASQALKLGEKLKISSPNTKHIIVGGTSSHVIHTAQSIQNSLGCSMQFYPELNGINLGVLHGLNEVDAQTAYPAAYAMLMSWSHGKLGIESLQIEGMENMASFKNRVVNKLAQIEAAYNCRVILVGTRSTLILIANVVRMHPDFRWSDYRTSKFEYCIEFHTSIRWSNCI